MRIVLCLAILFGSAYAQSANTEPYRAGDDLLQASMQAFSTHNLRCERKYTSPWQIIEEQTETEIQCSVDSGETGWDAMEETSKQPDFFWKHVPFKILRAAVAEKSGLTMWLAFPRTDYSTLISELERECGKPMLRSRLDGEGVVWENGISRLELQPEAQPDSSSSIAMVHQTKFFQSTVAFVMQKKVDENSKVLKK